MAKRSANDSVSRDERSDDHRDHLHNGISDSEMKVALSASSPSTAEDAAEGKTSTSHNGTRRNKIADSSKGNMKKCNKLWGFWSKKKPECSSCDLETFGDEIDDQSDEIAVSCLCTGLRRQAKHVQELPAGVEMNNEISCSLNEATMQRSGLSEELMASDPDQSPLEYSSTFPDTEPVDRLLLSVSPLSAEVVLPPPVNPRFCTVSSSSSANRSGLTSSSCILRSQRALHGHTVTTNNCNSMPYMATNEDVFVDCLNHHEHRLSASFIPQTIHTQVDYVHCLVPDLKKITNCSYYWGVMDRYEAERLLDSRPEGTFLLRDSAQEEFLFSVSFRRYSRSLHARVEHWNHKFSFDAHDTNVFASPSVCGLIEHYKDPACCMFFEPMLTLPLVRTFPFPLQHLCRAVICNIVTYDGISYLPIPKSLHQFLQYYHYKKKVRVRRFDATPTQQ